MKDYLVTRSVCRLMREFPIEEGIFASAIKMIDGASVDLGLTSSMSLEGLTSKIGFESPTNAMLGLLGDHTMRFHKECEAKRTTNRAGQKRLIGQPMQRSAHKGESPC